MGGLVLNLEYEAEGEWHELSVDLVAVLVLTKDQREKYLKCIPEQDDERIKLMARENVISPDDGLVAKKGEWRSSFSFSERNLVGLYPELYQALKYLNKVSENHIDIPTYLLKEIFCSYITNPALLAKRRKEESLAMSLARLIRYAETHPIATPFYGTKLGSQMSSVCRQLFNRVHSTFEAEFEAVKKEEELLRCRENISWEGSRFLTRWTEEAGFLDKRRKEENPTINVLIKNINAHFDI